MGRVAPSAFDFEEEDDLAAQSTAAKYRAKTGLSATKSAKGSKGGWACADVCGIVCGLR